MSLDGWLLVGAILVGIMTGGRLVSGRVRATMEERRRRLPGDECIPSASDTLTHAVTVAAPPAAVWPWLIQMGAGSRAGWYSYDFLDNGRQPSATTIVGELQDVAIGTVFPAMPGATDGFILLPSDTQQSLVRAARGYRFRGLPVWVSRPLIRVVHFVMQRKQLLEVTRRAESVNAGRREAA